jgi:hypothetical protein
MQNGELDGVHPKVIVLLAGTNNVGNAPASDAKVADISKGLKALLDCWADALKPLFTELLGPPAKEDHAPPPTGDPSAAKKKGSSESRPARPRPLGRSISAG